MLKDIRAGLSEYQDVITTLSSMCTSMTSRILACSGSGTFHKESPHMKAVIYHGLEGEDSTLCRGEQLIILRLILSELRKVRLLRHKVALLTYVTYYCLMSSMETSRSFAIFISQSVAMLYPTAFRIRNTALPYIVRRQST